MKYCCINFVGMFVGSSFQSVKICGKKMFSLWEFASPKVATLCSAGPALCEHKDLAAPRGGRHYAFFMHIFSSKNYGKSPIITVYS